ncbi:MAG: hypothetical protein AB1705_11335 [Verrucomicrobiota bacterium]
MSQAAASVELGALKELIATPELPGIGPGPRANLPSLPQLNQKVDEYLQRTTLPSHVHPLIRSAVLLWHDYLGASHSLSQEIHNQDGSFLHGIMHRREPDYSNAKYWFHRVGLHPTFERLGERVARKLDAARQPELKNQLLPHGRWDPFAFVDACERAARSESNGTARLLREIQQLEMEALFEHWCDA